MELDRIEKVLINESINYRWINKNKADRMIQCNRKDLTHFIKKIVKNKNCLITVIDSTFLIHN